MNFLLQPKKYKSLMADEGSRAIMNKTIQFFESMGKTRILEDYNNKVWYKEFIQFLGKERIFAKLLTPKEYGGSDPDCRWDTARNNEFSELLAFYGLGYQYCFQVSILGLGPIWMSKNKKAKQKAAQLLREGAIFAFGLSNGNTAQTSIRPQQHSRSKATARGLPTARSITLATAMRRKWFPPWARLRTVRMTIPFSSPITVIRPMN